MIFWPGTGRNDSAHDWICMEVATHLVALAMVVVEFGGTYKINHARVLDGDHPPPDLDVIAHFTTADGAETYTVFTSKRPRRPERYMNAPVSGSGNGLSQMDFDRIRRNASNTRSADWGDSGIRRRPRVPRPGVVRVRTDVDGHPRVRWLVCVYADIGSAPINELPLVRQVAARHRRNENEHAEGVKQPHHAVDTTRG